MKRGLTLAAVIVILVTAAALAGCVAPPTPAPTPVPPPDLWNQIQQAGTLVVGTSADYAPFEYYNRRYQLDGFDIGLMREIGKQLGVKVEIRDYAFDGLYNALQLGQIDAAISAISVTADRQRYVDFTNVYYVGKDGVLANGQSPITAITQVAQMADKRVGVQSGSVYEKFLAYNLVATKLMPADNLQAYPDIEQAVRDLQRKRLDLVLLDYQPAQSFVEQGGVKLVGEGLDPQSFAIAIPKGADSLRRVLNTALTDAVNSGAYAALAETYLGLKPDNIQPVPTPGPEQPTPPPAQPTPPSAACIDNMSYVADLTYDDHNMTAPAVMQPGQPFVKSWRVRNSGTCTWDSSYYLAYVSGNSPLAQMGGQPTYIKGTVAPGAVYDIAVDLIAPTQPGVYQGFWQMYNGQGTAFGTKVYVGIQVQAPVATAAPTQTPSPSINFSVSQTNITAGQCVVFTWNVQNVQAVYFYAQGQNMQDYGVAGQGSSTQCPTQTTTYNLTVVYQNNTSETRSITVYVTPPAADAPYISLFSVTPPQVGAGQCVNLQWDVKGTVDLITITRGGSTLWDGAPLHGSLQDCPPGTGSVGYTLVAKGPGGQSTAQQYVNVAAPATAVPPTAAPPTPVPPTAAPPTPIPPTATSVPQPPAIVGKNWLLTAYNNGQGGLVSPIAGTQITALFGSDGTVSGTDSCNNYTAPYTVSGNSLQVGMPAQTGMACADDIALQAQSYIAALQQAQSYQVSGNQLTIFGNSEQKLLQYVAQ